jgi:uncharacterized protein YdeI (YjbR/CyaY-like superfamily)
MPSRCANLSSATVQSDFKIRAFPTAKAWEQWLAKNHTSSKGLWLRFFKKSSSVKSVTHAEALDEALCHGWIDGQVKKYDDESWLHKFTPRRPRSIWSKRNRDQIGHLTEADRMKPAGLKEAEAARADGRWEKAYDSPGKMVVPEDFMKELSRNKKAKTFFETLNKANTYAIAWRLQTAKKPETREKRLKAILAMLAAGKKFHE